MFLEYLANFACLSHICDLPCNEISLKDFLLVNFLWDILSHGGFIVIWVFGMFDNPLELVFTHVLRWKTFENILNYTFMLIFVRFHQTWFNKVANWTSIVSVSFCSLSLVLFPSLILMIIDNSLYLIREN